MPFLHALAIAIIAAVLGFAGGCAKGKHSGGTDRMVLKAQTAIAREDVEACRATLADIQAVADADLAKADEAVEAGKRAVETVVRENLDLAGQLSAAEQALVAARTEQTCRAQLEEPLCAAIPLL